MKKTKLTLILLMVPFFTGCEYFDKALLVEQAPIVQSDGGGATVGDNQQADDDTQEAQGDLVPNPKVVRTIKVVGGLIPYPYADAIAGLVASGLGVYARFRQKNKKDRYKKGLLSAVHAAGEFKDALKAVDSTRAESVKVNVARAQDTAGTRDIIKAAISRL